MRVLTRYVLAEFLKLFVMCLLAFILIYMLVDFIDRSNIMFKNQATASEIARYIGYKVPLIAFQMIPVSVLLATLISLSILSRNSEITAMKAGGVSILRVTSPVLLFALMISGVSFAVNEFVVPYTNAMSEQVWREEIKGKEPRAQFRKKRIWYRSSRAEGWPESIYYIANLYPDKGRIENVSLFRFDEQFRLIRRGHAQFAQYDPSAEAGRAWTFYDGVYRRFVGDEVEMQTTFTRYRFVLAETIDDLKIERKKPEEMGFAELRDHVRKVRESGDDATRYEVDLQGKLSFPLVSFVMALLGIPFALKTGRSGGVALGIGVALTIGVVYWIVLALSLSLGHSGVLPPTAAAWSSHIAFGMIGVLMMVNMQQ
ncbi:MAG: LPS export ABC transporter permease LptG [Candidatus Alcyoniella australis]|nr:LPS export ABC transporter permease LptG [Candidatus Alcyoniella australis]